MSESQAVESTMQSVCARCGARLSSVGWREVCARCLLHSVIDQEDVDPDRALRRSDDDLPIEFGDYQLLEEVGRGGQGVVYRAHQKSLNRTVALKVISLGQWASKAHVKRFRREAEAAARLEHSCIVPIYEVGERDGSCYFSMQFIEGGPLDEVVRHAPMSIRQAAELIIKVARTVHYAHEHGILHRDIKPGNILFDRNGEPHLTDFGLARLLETESSVTRTIDVLGTPSYMAPEQAAGETTKLGNATDVYGLGAVLYQLLTGQPPFVGGTTYETIRLLRDTEPRAPRQLNPKIDRDLSTICLKCLEKDPQRRYSSALALAEDLERWLKHEPIRAHRTSVFTRGKKWVRRNRSIAVMAAMLLALAVPLGVMIWKAKTQLAIPNPMVPEKSIAVLPFENLSHDPDNAYFAEGIQEEILTRLAKIADLKVISRASTQHYQSKARNLAEIAKQLGVANILEGTVQKAADQVRVNVQLIKPETDSHLWADTYDRKLTDILGVEGEIAKQIAESLQAKLTGREEQALAVKPTNNPQAYDTYLRGLAFDARAGTDFGLLGQVIDSYERAVQLDPNFAVAWARLSRANSHVYVIKNTRANRDAAKRALEQAQKLDPDSPETLLAFAFYQAVVLNDYEAAQTAAARVNEMLPRSSEAVRILALVAKYAGRWDESVSYYERALSLDPRNVDLLTVAAWTYIALRQFPQALKLLDRVLDITPNEFGAMASKIRVYQAQGNLEEAAKLISVCEQVFPSRVSGDWLQLRLERKYGEAIQWLQAQLAQSQPDEDKADMLLTLALTQHLTGATASAKVTAEQTRDILERLYRDNPEEPGRASQLSWDYALMGKRDLALNLAEHTVMLKPRAKDPVGGPGWEVELAGIQTLVGNNSEAISTLTKLLQTPFSGGSFIQGPPITPAVLRLDPIWDPLRGDPAFQKLCQDKLDRSIAVLPFENLSGDPNNAYFADGIQEEILTRLAKIADLKVISRTSTQRYHSKPGNLAEIAKQLGVANILEGSIQKAADQVRVNVQLINALSDSHVWADTYDRKLTDIFGVESEIAKGIAESLQARLTGREEQALAVKPTTNPEAYDAYLRGLSLDTRNYGTSYSQDLEIKAAASYERAVQLDPKFAFAWARLSYADAQIYNSDSNVDRGEAAKHAAEQALKLAPNSPEVLIPFGSYQTSMLRDFEGAKATWERAHKMLPGNSEALSGLGAASRWEGHWDESFSYYEQALTLDPRNVRILMNAAYTYTIARRFPAALKLYDRVLDITPDDLGVKATKASIYQAQGNLAEAARLLSGIDEHTPNEAIFGKKATQLQLERNYGELARLLQARLTQFHYSELDKAGYQSWLAFAQVWGGDTAGGRANAEQACNTLQQFYRDHPDDGNPNVAGLGVPIGLSEAYALLGEKDLALKLAEHIVTRKWRFPLNPVEAPGLKEYLATIQAIVGENSSAISTFTELLQTPYTSFMNGPIPITPASLRLDPTLDPLRSDPRFQKLCQEK